MAREHRENKERNEEQDDIVERLVSINRVAKVVKGGKRFGFAALVVVGDGKGRIGHASAKAREVPDAIQKASQQARRNMVRVPLREGRTLHHDIFGRFGSGKVHLRAAPAGTGVIAGGPIRAVFEALGIQDVVAKSLGSNNPHNMVKAALAGLLSTQSPRAVASRRSKRVSDVLGKAKGDAAEQTDAE
jgi:small subunit ribosomal protein S5